MNLDESRLYRLDRFTLSIVGLIAVGLVMTAWSGYHDRQEGNRFATVEMIRKAAVASPCVADLLESSHDDRYIIEVDLVDNVQDFCDGRSSWHNDYEAAKRTKVSFSGDLQKVFDEQGLAFN